MADVVVRSPQSADFHAVATLLSELGRPALTEANRAALQAGFEHYLERQDTAPLLAEQDGQLVGFLSLEFRQRLNRERLQAWIPDLIVTASARGQGAGRALLNRAFELARERGCWSVTLESGHQRKVAHELYRSAGMKEVGFYFLLEL
jgi:GNAT superfamily N-acetyltransferase